MNKFNCEENKNKKQKNKKISIASWTGLILKRREREKREIVVREMIMRVEDDES